MTSDMLDRAIARTPALPPEKGSFGPSRSVPRTPVSLAQAKRGEDTPGLSAAPLSSVHTSTTQH